MRFSAGFTLFYPSQKEIEVILNYCKVFGQIYIFDNTDKFEVQQVNEKTFKNDDRIKYISTNQNLGLSIALNQICEISFEDGYEYVCLFDQDSYISDYDLRKIFEIIIHNKDESIGMFCPEIIYDDKIAKETNDENSLLEIGWTITSGSFINLKIFKSTDGFDEKYFIDRLDYDYCFYLKKSNYKIIRIKNVFLFQQLGERKKVMGINVFEHNVIRHYYVFRNRLYFYLSKDFSIYNMLKVIILSIKHFFSILLESNKIKKIKIIWKSMSDFLAGNMGKFID